MKVPEPRKLSSGAWFIQLRLNGVSIPVTATTKTECKRQAAMIKAEYRAGKREISRTQTELTLSQAIDKYIEDKRNELSPSTIRGYKAIQVTRFKRYMDRPIKSIKNWQDVYNNEIQLVSPKTLKNSFALIKSVYKHVTGKPISEVNCVPVVPKPRPYLDYAQIQIFLDAIHGDHCEIGALLALHSLRSSEIFGLTWEYNIDLVNRQIKVAGAAVLDEHSNLIHKETNKTAASRRYVPIFIPRLTELLEATPNKQGRVITYETSGGLRVAINRICKSVNLPTVGIHGLRHSFASLAVHLGLPEETAMAIGGWSDFHTMRKIYTHISHKDMKAHVNSLTEFYENANKNANIVQNTK